MTTRIDSPPLRGAIAAYSGQILGPPPRIVFFQYNPENVTRSLQHQTRASSDESGLEEAARRWREHRSARTKLDDVETQRTVLDSFFVG